MIGLMHRQITNNEMFSIKKLEEVFSEVIVHFLVFGAYFVGIWLIFGLYVVASFLFILLLMGVLTKNNELDFFDLNSFSIEHFFFYLSNIIICTVVFILTVIGLNFAFVYFMSTLFVPYLIVVEKEEPLPAMKLSFSPMSTKHVVSNIS